MINNPFNSLLSMISRRFSAHDDEENDADMTLIKSMNKEMRPENKQKKLASFSLAGEEVQQDEPMRDTLSSSPPMFSSASSSACSSPQFGDRMLSVPVSPNFGSMPVSPNLLPSSPPTDLESLQSPLQWQPCNVQATGTKWAASVDNLALPYSMTYSANTELLYVLQPKSNQIVVVDRAGNQVGCFGNNMLYRPCGIAVWTDKQQQDELYVVDCSIKPRVFVLSHKGDFLRCFGLQQLASPSGIAVDGERVYVTDRSAHNVVVFSKAGRLITKFGSEGTQPGQLKQPTTVCVSSSTGVIYVGDRYNYRITMFDQTGKYLGQFARGTLFQPKRGAYSTFSFCLSPSGDKLFVVDATNDSVLVFWADGSLVDRFGSHGSARCQFSSPIAVTQDINSCLYVSDSNNHRVCLFA